jgi:DsbC/DsbD-like thiol-disulfide interchange protein
MKLFLSFCTFLLATITYSQKDPVKWTFTSTKEGDSKVINLKAEVAPGWYIYSQNIGENGPIPTSLTFEESKSFTVDGLPAGEVSEHKKEGFDPIFEMNLIKYSEQVTFIKSVSASKATTVKGFISYMTCNDSTCLPPKEVEFSIAVPQ